MSNNDRFRDRFPALLAILFILGTSLSIVAIASVAAMVVP